jgi:hypothetical protein
MESSKRTAGDVPTGTSADAGEEFGAGAGAGGGAAGTIAPAPHLKKFNERVEKAKRMCLESSFPLNQIYQEVVVGGEGGGVTDAEFFQGLLPPELADPPQDQGVASNIGDRFGRKNGETVSQLSRFLTSAASPTEA